jgi:hypothetical protein
MAVCDPERPRRAGKTVKQAGAPPACSHSGWFRASRSDHSPHMPMSGRCVHRHIYAIACMRLLVATVVNSILQLMPRVRLSSDKRVIISAYRTRKYQR